MISGEIHPARIPAEYWRHRIQMAKAMGCNTIAAYIFWNYNESDPACSIFRSETTTLLSLSILFISELNYNSAIDPAKDQNPGY